VAGQKQVIVTATPPTRVLYNDGDETHGLWVKTRGIHALRLPPVIRIARYLVTNALYLQFVRSGGYKNDEYWRGRAPTVPDRRPKVAGTGKLAEFRHHSRGQGRPSGHLDFLCRGTGLRELV
jgi:formylglycine-generating enzyme required for sulfatase activity